MDLLTSRIRRKEIMEEMTNSKYKCSRCTLPIDVRIYPSVFIQHGIKLYCTDKCFSNRLIPIVDKELEKIVDDYIVEQLTKL